MITPGDLGGDEDLARRVLVLARSIAPCINDLSSGSESWKDAVAILRGVLANVITRGATSVESQRIGPAQVKYVVSASSFSTDDRASLRALCPTVPSGLPLGSFPPSGVIGRVWPEGEYV